MTLRAPPRISVGIPVYNEATALSELLRRVLAVVDSQPGGPHEVVLVDDGSSDGSREALRQAAVAEPQLKVVLLSRNFGHQAALTAALDHARGDVVILMDGDLQDEPEAIPRFIEAYREGADVVYAIRVGRKESLPLRACYFVFYRLAARLATIPLPLEAGDFSLMSRPVVDAINACGERQRYLRGLRAWAGYRQVGLEIERAPRHSGTRKYGPRALVRLALDGIFAFSVVPLRLATFVGFLAVLCTFVYAAYAVIARLAGDTAPQGFTALIVAIVFIGGVQLFFLGVVGEYVGRIYEETKRRPHFVVEAVVQSDKNDR